MLKTLQSALRLEAERSLEPLEVTLPQLGVLRTLWAEPGASNAELARFAFISPQSMGELLAVLERARLISRSVDPENARVLRRKLTAAGARVAREGLALVGRTESRMVASLTRNEAKQLQALLERCIESLQSR